MSFIFHCFQSFENGNLYLLDFVLVRSIQVSNHKHTSMPLRELKAAPTSGSRTSFGPISCYTLPSVGPFQFSISPITVSLPWLKHCNFLAFYVLYVKDHKAYILSYFCHLPLVIHWVSMNEQALKTLMQCSLLLMTSELLPNNFAPSLHLSLSKALL